MIYLVAILIFAIGIAVEEYFIGTTITVLIYLFNSNRLLQQRVSQLENYVHKQHAVSHDIDELNQQSCDVAKYESTLYTDNPSQVVIKETFDEKAGSGTEKAEASQPLPQTPDSFTIPNKALTSEPKDTEKLIISNAFSKLFSSVVTGLAGPLGGVFDSFLKIYHHYKDQGKAPVFFLTVAGMTTLIMGFGYLLQYSFNQYLSPVGKVCFAYLLALAVMAVGIIIYKKRPNMTDYAASLIGLSLVLLYLCTYFLGPYYQLTSDTFTFILLAGITAGGYLLAKLFETRVVALISLLGGACAPALITGAAWNSPLLYLTYLLLICAAALPLAFSIRWQLLAQVSFVTSIAFIEYTLLNSRLELTYSVSALILIHAFFYLLCGNIYVQWATFSAKRSGVLTQLSAALLFMLVALEQLTLTSNQYGILLLVNASIALFIFVASKIKSYSYSVDVGVFSLLSCGFFAGISLLVLTAPQLLGLIWGFEGAILLYLGLHFGYPIVRQEAYVLMTIALITTLGNTIIWLAESIQPLPVFLALEFNDGYLNLVSLLAVISVIPKLLSSNLSALTERENTIHTISLQLSYALSSVVFILTVGCIWPTGFWLFSIVPLFALIYISYQKQWPYLEKFALSHWFLLTVPILTSGIYLGNFHFGEQSLIAKLARVIAFIGLWAIAYYYRRFAKLSPIFINIQRLDTLFYLILPIFFLPSVLRRAPDYFAVALWVSVTISMLIYYKMPRPALWKMANVLAYTAALGSIFTSYLTEFTNWQGDGISPLLVGIALSLLLFIKIRAFSAEPYLSRPLHTANNQIITLFTAAIIYWGLSIMILVYGVSSDLTYTLISGTFYCFALVWLPQFRAGLKQHYGKIMYVIWLTCLCSALSIWTALSASSHQLSLVYVTSVCIPLILVAIFIAYTDKWMFVLARRLAKSNKISILLCHACLTSVYLSVVYFLQASLMGPFVSILLVIHGTNLLFHTLKYKYQWLMPITIGYFVVATAKVALWDISDFPVVQKILAFMLIGSILLVAAYQYQKLKARNEQSSS